MNANERGSTLLITMLLLLLMLGLAVTMTHTARSNSRMMSSAKLNQFYQTAANSVFNQVRVNLGDYWVEKDVLEDAQEDYRWNFGDLLHQASAKENTTNGNFPESLDLPYKVSMNAGLMSLPYKVWVYNNPDDPAYLLKGMDVGLGGEELKISENWDLDRKVLLKVEIFSPGDSTNAVATQSAILTPTGAEYVNRYDEAVYEGDESDVSNKGSGSTGTYDRIEIASLEDAEEP